MAPENKLKAVKKALYVLPFREINRSKFTAVGGKGANLGELSGIKGYRCRMVFALPPKRIKR